VPEAHDWHACVEEEEYLPALQGVHEVAPADTRVFVTLPALHAMQPAEDVLPVVGLYLPATHPEACVEKVE